MNLARGPKRKEWHTANTKYGMGDHYGTGIKQPVAKPVRSYLTDSIPERKLSKPPKSLA